MKYNPDIHHRRSIRLTGYDYSQAGLYFVTICCDQRKHRFGRIEDGKMIMNEYGNTAYNEWLNITERFDQIEIDAFQIMPNHMHGIIAIGAGNISVGVGVPLAGAPVTGAPVTAGAGIRAGASPAPTVDNITGVPNGTVGDIVGAYKSLVANACLKIYKSNHQTMGKLWQRNYWEHIIRNEQELFRIRQYIENNPAQWGNDKLNGGVGNRVLESQTEYGWESWMI